MSIDLKKAQQLKIQLSEYLNENSGSSEIVKKNLTKKQLENAQEILMREGANTNSRGSEEINWAVREIQGGSGMGSGCVLFLIEQILSKKIPYNFEEDKDKDNRERERERERESKFCSNCSKNPVSGNSNQCFKCKTLSKLEPWETKAKEFLEGIIAKGEESGWNINHNHKVCKKCVPGEPPSDFTDSPWEKYHVSASNSLGDETTYNHVCLKENSNKNNGNDKGKKIKEFCEKIFEKCPELKNSWGWYYQEGRGQNEKDNGREWKWCVGTPLWLKKVDKQEAVELKKLLENCPAFGYGGVCPYQNWLPSNQSIIGSDGKVDQRKFKSIAVYDESGKNGSVNSELIKELDRIIEQGEKQNDKGNNKKPQPDLKILLSTLNQLQQFFIANNIHSITNQNGNLVITFNQNQTNPNSPPPPPPPQTITEEELSETSTLMEPEQKSMWKKFKDYLKKTGKNKMDKQELEQEINKLKNQTEQKPDKLVWPWIVGGIGIIAVVGIVIVLIRKRKNKIRKAF